YDQHPILSNVTMTIPSGSRIGLIGANGAGKTTLVKLLAGLLLPIAGQRLEGKGLRIGYFAQHQVELLREDENALQHMRRLDPQTREQQLRDFLGQFNFSGEAAMQLAGTMSGGEQARLALALIIWQRPNLLLLDEPTNHLDLDMREALTIALQEFEGTMILVSHDRHLLRTSTDQLVLVANGRATPYDGDLDEYRAYLEGKVAPAREVEAPAPVKAMAPAVSTTAAANAGNRRDDRRDAALGRTAASARRKPLTDRITRLEREIAKLEPEKKRLDALLASESIYAAEQREALKTATFDAAKVVASLQTLEEEWLVLQAELESLVTP
ncbi:MAG: ATP-binding cassette domain-containing protein, partial [Burkholderiales bacterium]